MLRNKTTVTIINFICKAYKVWIIIKAEEFCQHNNNNNNICTKLSNYIDSPFIESIE